jgi:hypothetical protein
VTGDARLYCTLLYGTALYSTVMYCTVLYSTVTGDVRMDTASVSEVSNANSPSVSVYCTVL